MIEEYYEAQSKAGKGDIENQRSLDARYAELTRLAKENVCKKCGGNLEVVWCPNWHLWCASCQNTWSIFAIKLKPTQTELVKERLAKMELAAKTPTNKYNIDELFKEV